ncbi:putative secreted protein [Granulibacter bethesdensis]|uniref:Secreted protein n=2 Tax=Granulibacter bethesdensis TaxID=364410 RepID=A0AAN0RDY4_9PROT|nr:putative secreted protein [Granulibacter bethesdensis]
MAKSATLPLIMFLYLLRFLRLVLSPAHNSDIMIKLRYLKIIALILFVVLALFPKSLMAQCRVSLSNLDFGIYDPYSSTQATTSANINVIACRILFGSYSISLNTGQYAGGSYSNRSMGYNSNRLRYQIYTSNDHSSIWGNNSQGTVMQYGYCYLFNCDNFFTMYGVIPRYQNVSPGFYTDTVVVTITY